MVLVTRMIDKNWVKENEDNNNLYVNGTSLEDIRSGKNLEPNTHFDTSNGSKTEYVKYYSDYADLPGISNKYSSWVNHSAPTKLVTKINLTDIFNDTNETNDFKNDIAIVKTEEHSNFLVKLDPADNWNTQYDGDVRNPNPNKGKPEA